GNSGPRYQSLTSPGLARRVIDVGATTKTDALWTYSSRGPVQTSWDIKPDLVAPGVNISSTFPGGYAYGTGTSGSTPHVAGAAALLRQLHPAWSPDQVKAALMNTAKDLGRSPYDQGAGRLQADQAAVTPALVLPPSLSLGRADPTQPVWTRQEALTVVNVSTATVTYTLSIAGSFPAGVTRSVTPNQVVVGPGGSAAVTFTIAVDTALVPDKTAAPFAYWGAIRAIPSGHAAPALRVPFAFIKAPLLRLHVDEAPISVMLLRHGDPLVSRYATPVTTTSDHLLPAGTYDVVVQYQQPYAYVLQTVELTRTAEITLPRAAAIHQARIAFTDEAGQTAAPNHAVHRLMRGGNGWLVSETSVTAPISEVVRFSDLPSTYVWERTVTDADPTSVAYRQWHGRFEGISSDLEFLTAPADFARVDHPLRPRPLPQPGVAVYDLWELIGYATPTYSYMVGPTVPPVTVPYERRAYYRTPPPGYELYALRFVAPDLKTNVWAGTLTSPWLQLDAERRLTWQQPSTPLQTYYRVPTGAGVVEPLGLGPAHWFARFATTTPDSVRLVAAQGTWLFYRAYQGGDTSWEQRQPYELWQGDTLIGTGDIGASTGGSQALISLPVSGTYTLTLPLTYTLGATEVVTGHGTVTAVFDTRQVATDANPPTVSVLRILDAASGQPTDAAAGPVQVRLVVTDDVSAPTVTVAYDVGTGWVPVTVTPATDDEYAAELPGLPDGVLVRLRIVARDAAGNTLTHLLEPAYLVRWGRLYLPIALKDAG
ncbi:MAG: S8 family serine peptidase, partial [Chloroflexi bacterium]|nr:S8 family serine peptidase [Chloroflexota bacterium]